MYFLYIIKSEKNGTIYIGTTNDLKRRLREHNTMNTFSTKRYAPWKFVYIEGYINRENADDREKKLKQFGRVYSQLKRRISRSLES